MRIGMNAEDIKEMKDVLKSAEELITAYYIADDDTYEGMFKKINPALFRVFNVLGSDYDEFSEIVPETKVKLTKPTEEEQVKYDEDSDDFLSKTKCPEFTDTTCTETYKDYINRLINTNKFKNCDNTCTCGTKFVTKDCDGNLDDCITALKNGEEIVAKDSLIQDILDFLADNESNYYAKVNNNKLKVKFFK